MTSPNGNGSPTALQPLLSPHPTPTSIPPPPSIRLQYCTSLLAMLSVGTAYSFSSWAPDLKTRLSFTQSDIEMIGYMGNLGLLLPFAAILVHRFSPAVALIPGAVLIACGNLALGLAVSGWEAVPAWVSHPGVMALANAVVIIGITCVYILVISINAGNLPANRLGVGLSVLVTCYGLSASFFSLLYVYVLQQNLLAYFLTAGILASSVCALNAFTLKKIPRTDPSLSTASTITEGGSDEEQGAKLADGTLMSAFRVLAFAGRRVEFWGIVAFMLTTSGTGYAVINNTGNVVQSLNEGADPSFTFLCILTLSAGNALGRLGMGLSDLVTFRRGWFGVMSACLMFAVWTYNSFLVSTKQQWLLTSFCTGLSFGSAWAFAPIFAAETFHPSLFAIVWGWIASTPPIASLLFNHHIGTLYDRYADASHNCWGRKCWVEGWGTGMAVTAVGIGLSVAMVKYTKVGKQVKEEKERKGPRTSTVIPAGEKGGDGGVELT